MGILRCRSWTMDDARGGVLSVTRYQPFVVLDETSSHKGIILDKIRSALHFTVSIVQRGAGQTMSKRKLEGRKEEWKNRGLFLFGIRRGSGIVTSDDLILLHCSSS